MIKQESTTLTSRGRQVRSAFSRRRLARLAAVGLLLAAGTAASALPAGARPLSDRPVAAPNARLPLTAAAKEKAARAALRGLRIGYPQSTAPRVPGSPTSIPSKNSPNWAGYDDTTTTTSSGKFRTITANWHVPQVAAGSCSSGSFATGLGLAAFWVGIDGAGSGTVEQTGTITECNAGSASYFDWYEMYPQPLVVLNSVNPGDLMLGTVEESGGVYFVSIVDVTQGHIDVATTLACGGTSCPNVSAEVVAEAPGGCTSGGGTNCRGPGNGSAGSYFLLPNFVTASFFLISDSTFFVGGGLGKSSFGPAKLTMVNSANIKLVSVSKALSGDGFIVSWHASA